MGKHVSVGAAKMGKDVSEKREARAVGAAKMGKDVSEKREARAVGAAKMGKVSAAATLIESGGGGTGGVACRVVRDAH
jgi:hypothetical protein